MYTVPEEQLHLPRHQRQHPFRAANGSEAADVRREMGEAIANMDGMIYTTIIRGMTAREKRYRFYWLDEVRADVLLHLCEKSLPQYDAWRPSQAKVSII
jgi:hypothetical protein